MSDPTRPDSTEAGHLSLWDATSIIIGIVVGTSIFKVPQQIAASVESPAMAMAAWLLGGVLSLAGAFCYAELASAYPRSGGDYNYLTMAFSRWVGFLFAWAQLAFVITGSVGIMAFAFADYACVLFGLGSSSEVGATWNFTLALVAVVSLTAINMAGVVVGKLVQNILTVLKIVGLSIVALAALFAAGREPTGLGAAAPNLGFGVAMVLVLYAYGGWNDAAYVAAEVRDRRRDLPRALIFGTAGITLVYLVVNAAYFYGLGFENVRRSPEPAADIARLAWGDAAARAVSVLVMVSALGAINGLIFAGSRVYAVLGRDHVVFRWLGHWDYGRGSPLVAMAAQAMVTVLLMFVVATPRGRAAVDVALVRTGFEAMPWERFGGGFGSLVAVTAPVFWAFFLLTGLALFVLRWKDAATPRPYKVPLFPATAVVFCLMCVYMLDSSIRWAGQLSLLGAALLLVGMVLYAISRIIERRGVATRVTVE
jgi:amino acid transporter